MGGLAASWPNSGGALNREQILSANAVEWPGYQSGNPDGLFGSATRTAVRGFQTDRGLPADGFPDSSVAGSRRARRRYAGAGACRTGWIDAAFASRSVCSIAWAIMQARLTARIGERHACDPCVRAARGMEVRGRATDVVLKKARRLADQRSSTPHVVAGCAGQDQ